MRATLARRTLLGALAVAAALVAAVTSMGSGPAPAAGKRGTAVSPHVVIVGLSGLRWTDVSASATPALWTMARAGSPGSLVAFAVGPHTCPADAWLTLNGGDRAQARHTSKGPCPALPAVALFAVFAVINYLIPATGQSNIGAFAGNLFHGHSGGLLLRKLTSMLGSIALSPAVLPVIILVGLILLRPSWFAVKAISRAYAAEPLLAMTLAMMWLVCVLGWFADDSGIAVPANALPLALPLAFALLAGVPLTGAEAASRGPTVTGSSVTGRIG